MCNLITTDPLHDSLPQCVLCVSSDSAVGPEKDLDGGKIRVSEEGTMNQEARRLKLTDLPPEQAERSLL